ncbi:hypothetical protein BH10PAT3_BH10PAT3_7880 [soil metagenome]
MFMWRKNKKESGLVARGDELVREFVSALTNASVVEGMKYEAARNEERTLRNIASASAGNNIYVRPEDIPLECQAAIAKDSVDAHMQKTQALQAESYNVSVLQAAAIEASERYEGKKVAIFVRNHSHKPVDTIWRDARTGALHINERSPRKVVGIVKEINLAKNYLIIRPTFAARAVNKTIEFHRVYIVNPADMQPLVRLEF